MTKEQMPCLFDGHVCMSLEDYKHILEEAAEAGARKALENPAIAEVKDLLDCWRLVKKTVLQTLTKAFTVGILTVMLLGLLSWFKKNGVPLP